MLSGPNRGLLVDTNLLVLFAVGSVNPSRIANFKRTSKYEIRDFDLLVRVLEQWTELYTLPHVLAEVSNLTDLSGRERLRARQILKQTISFLNEAQIASAQAAEDPVYETLGLVDAAIAAVARENKCAVLTDDLDLYLILQRDRIDVVNFTHLRARALGV
ncbi:MAG: PIN domain-containing protein [Bryobacteraceae bacterium]